MGVDTSLERAGTAVDGDPGERGVIAAGPPWPDRAVRAACWALLALTVLPVLVAGVDGLGRAWFPAGDWAMTELRVLDVGGGDTPLVGPYSRFSWNHPGPLLFWILAVPYRLAGGSSSALLGAAALVNAASLAGMLAFAWRRGRLPLVAVLAVALATCVHSMGPTLVRDPWNAWVTTLPFGLLLVAVWSAFEGDRVGLLAVPVVGSFLAQSHVGFVPLVAVLTVVGVAGFVRREPDRRPLVIATGLLALCWLPVVVGTVTGDGNVGRIFGHFAGGRTDEPAGLGYAWEVAALQLGTHGPWRGGSEPINPAGGTLLPGPGSAALPAVSALAVAAAVAWRRRVTAPGDLSLVIVIAAATVTAVLAVSRITGGVFDYLVRWWWPLAALWWAAVAWILGRAVAAAVTERRPGRARWWRWAPAILVVVAVVLVGRSGFETAGAAGAGRLPVDDWRPAMAALPAPPAELDRAGPVLLRNVGPLSGWASDAYSVQLARAGVDVRVDDSGINRYKFGPHRLWDGEPDVPVIWLVTGSWIDDFAREGTGRELARFDPLTPDERVDHRTHEHRLRLALRAADRDDLEAALDEGTSLLDAAHVPGVDPADVEAVEEARSRGVPVALYLVTGPAVSLPAHEP